MQKGSTSTQFKVAGGREVRIRVVAIGAAQLETVAGAKRVPDPGAGNVYAFVAAGAVQPVALSCTFAEKSIPPAKYRFEVWEPGEDKIFKPPAIDQPSGKKFPKTVTIALEFNEVEAHRHASS